MIRPVRRLPGRWQDEGKEQGQAGGGMAIAGIVLGWVGIALTIVGFGLMIYFVNKVDSLYDPSLFDPELYTS